MHLRPSEDGTVTVSITADRFYPAAQRGALSLLAARRHAGDPDVEISVHDSSDTGLVGVLVRGTRRPADSEDLRVFVDATLTDAADFFRAAAAPFHPIATLVPCSRATRSNF